VTLLGRHNRAIRVCAGLVFELPEGTMAGMKIAVGADHAGFELKEQIKRQLAAAGIQLDDRGTHSGESVDYPDFARRVGEEVASKQADFGILVCGTGIGMSMSANKVPGIRAAKADTEFEAEMARAHNDANVLCLGARVTDAPTAEKLVRKFLETRFEAGRHQRRVDKIMALDRSKTSWATDSHG
jgi:ribose 5-phosphate isomerase B